MKKKLVIVFLLFLLLNTGAYLFRMSPLSLEKDLIRIAVVGPMESPKGVAMRKGIELYEEQINTRGGIHGRKMKLLFYDDKNDPQTAEKIASKIAEENHVLAVIGHYYSSTSTAAGSIYKRSEIPAITASATAESVIVGNDWYFRVVPDNALEGRFVANYIEKGLKKKAAGIIFTKDSYGISLAENFENTLKALGMKMTGKWEWDLEKSPEEQVKRISEELKTVADPGILFLATHTPEGVKLITGLKDAGLSLSMIVSDAFPGDFFHELKPYPLEWSNPGYYSDGIWFVSPFIMDIGGTEAFRFRDAYYDKYQEDSGEVVSVCYYDAIHVAAEAIKKISIQGKKQIREDRRKIRKVLAGFYNEENAVKGVTGSIWFDENGGVRRHFAVGIWQKQKALPAFYQYRQYSGNVDNMIQTVLDGGIILAGDILMNLIRIVHVNAEIIELSDIDTKKSEFSADFQLTFRCQGSFDDTNIEFENAVTPVVLGSPAKEETADGITTRIWRIKARFRTGFDFRSYPFDSLHKMYIRFRHTDRTDDKLIYVSDTLFTPSEYTVSVWNMPFVVFWQDSLSKNTSLGNPNYFGSEHKISYSRFNAEIWLSRKNQALFVCLKLLPFLLIAGGLYLTYFIPSEHLKKRILILMTALLANTGLHLRHLATLAAGYMTIMDFICFGLYLLILLSLFFSVFVHSLHRQGKEKTRNILVRTARIAYPCITVALIASVIMLI